jgi:hypothetical protein
VVSRPEGTGASKERESTHLVEEGDDLGNDESKGDDEGDAAEPGDPVRPGRLLKVDRAAEEPDKNELDGKVYGGRQGTEGSQTGEKRRQATTPARTGVDDRAREEAGKGDAIGDLLDGPVLSRARSGSAPSTTGLDPSVSKSLTVQPSRERARRHIGRSLRDGDERVSHRAPASGLRHKQVCYTHSTK